MPMELEYESRLTKVETLTDTNSKRLDDVEKRQDNLDALVTTVQTLAVREEQVEKDVKEVKSDVKTIVGKSGKRWEELVDKIIWAIVAAFVGYLLAQLGLG